MWLYCCVVGDGFVGGFGVGGGEIVVEWVCVCWRVDGMRGCLVVFIVVWCVMVCWRGE